MADQSNDKRPHFVLTNTSEAKPFTAHGGGGSEPPPELPRAQHGAALQVQVVALRQLAEAAVAKQIEQGLESG